MFKWTGETYLGGLWRGGSCGSDRGSQRRALLYPIIRLKPRPKDLQAFSGLWRLSWPAGGGWINFPLFRLDHIFGHSDITLAHEQFRVPDSDHKALRVQVSERLSNAIRLCLIGCIIIGSMLLVYVLGGSLSRP